MPFTPSAEKPSILQTLATTPTTLTADAWGALVLEAPVWAFYGVQKGIPQEKLLEAVELCKIPSIERIASHALREWVQGYARCRYFSALSSGQWYKALPFIDQDKLQDSLIKSGQIAIIDAVEGLFVVELGGGVENE